MPGEEIPGGGLDLQHNRELLSPRYLVEPLHRCALSVTVRGFVPHAELDVDVGVVDVDPGRHDGHEKRDRANPGDHYLQDEPTIERGTRPDCTQDRPLYRVY